MKTVLPIKRFILLSLSILCCFGLNAQKLTKKERNLTAAVEKNNAEAIAFLEKVVNINSGTMNAEGVKSTGNVFMQAFDDIGFTTEWIDMPAEMNRAGHLFASIEGNKGKRLLLIGHLDTVFEDDSEFQKFEPVNDSIAKGPGA
ncbi:MAG: M20 family peptidase, partial [Leeuwenhoekiella sp.]